MTTTLVSTFSDFFDPARLFGPIFNKELRVSSRLRRNYLLRFAYIVLLSVFILSVWYGTVGPLSSSSAVYAVSRLAQAGRQVIITIAWFQFIACQLIAVVMLSSSISDEVRTGTLSVLMTTPIGGFQIVAGKLLSKLLQLILLLAISLPLLAIVRVFGGVSWDYVVSSICITLTATLLAGALSFLLSITYRHAHTVILVTMAVYMLFFSALPGLFNMLAVKGIFGLDRQVTQSMLALTNPFVAFAASNAKFTQSGVPGFFSWPLHCLLMLVVIAVLVAVSVWQVRRAGTAGTFDSAKRLRLVGGLERAIGSIFYTGGAEYADYYNIIPVEDPPVVWKEMRKGFIGRSRGETVMFVLLIGAFLIAVVLLLLSSSRDYLLQYYFRYAFYMVVVIRMAVFSAGSITAEKEARTWPVLLATPLENKAITRGKAIASFRRNVPLLLLYIILLFISNFKMAGVIHFPVVLLITALALLPLASSILFVIGSGLYFGTRFRTTATAVVATVGFYLALTFLFCGTFNPLNRFFYMIVRNRAGQWLYFSVTIVRSLTVGALGLSLARCARRRLRRNIF